MLSLNMVRNTLSKSERLSSLKAIEQLFADGQHLSQYPIRLVWISRKRQEMDTPVRVMFSASKKKFARAVDRNRIKRLMREGYRLHKTQLYTRIPPELTYDLALIYTGKEIESMEHIQNKIIRALGRMLDQQST
jgi:ribonuclease P protein component